MGAVSLGLRVLPAAPIVESGLRQDDVKSCRRPGVGVGLGL